MQEPDLDLNALNQLLPDGIPKGWLTKAGKALDPYYRGPTKKLRKREDVLAARKRQKEARKAQRGNKCRGQKNNKGRRNARAAT